MNTSLFELVGAYGNMRLPIPTMGNIERVIEMMDSFDVKLNVVTNWHKRPIIYWHELTNNEREQFDYIKENERDWFNGFRYRGSVYDLGEFEIAPDIIKREGFDGWQTQSYFDGIAVKYFDIDGYEYDDVVIVAHIHW